MGLYRPTWKDKKTGETKTSRVWWYLFRRDGKKHRINLHVKERRAAEMKLGPILKALERGDVVQQTTRTTPLSQLVEDYEKELKRRGCTEHHAAKTRYRVERIVQGLSRLEEVTPERIREALARISAEGDNRRPGTRRPGKLSAKTVNDFRTCLSGLFTWLVKEGRWEKNPVQAVPRVDYHGPENPRRALTPDELATLLACEKVRFPRRAVYLVAATTGLRRSELGSLTWAHVDLDGASVTLEAKSAKNRRAAVLPLRADAVEALKRLREEAEVEAKKEGTEVTGASSVFAKVPLVRTFYKDLERAEIIDDASEYVTEDGRLDFHGLRVTFATNLARADVSLVMAQKLMRHSDPRLTANVYTRLELHDAHAAVARTAPERLGSKPGAPSEPLHAVTGLTEPEASPTPEGPEAAEPAQEAGLTAVAPGRIRTCTLGFEAPYPIH